MRLQLLLRSLADGSQHLLPLDGVLPVDSADQLKIKILHAFPQLTNDGDFFIAYNGAYLDDGTNRTAAEFGITDNVVVQLVRVQEILAQQQQHGNEVEGTAVAAAAAADARRAGNSSQYVDVASLAATANGLSSSQKDGKKSNNPNRTAADREEEENVLKQYKIKSRKNKWKIRAELLPNDGGRTTVTVHDSEVYDKTDCLKHALVYDPQDAATWAALGAALSHPSNGHKRAVTFPAATDRNSSNTQTTKDGKGEEDETVFTAVDCFAMSLRIDPMNSHVWVSLGASLSADLKQHVFIYDRQVNRRDCFARAAEIDPMYPRAWYNLSLLLSDIQAAGGDGTAYVGVNQETVESCLLRVLQYDPRHAGAWVSLGLLLAFSYEGADNDVVSMGGSDYDRRGCLVQALKCDMKHARAWYNVGITIAPQQQSSSSSSDAAPLTKERALLALLTQERNSTGSGATVVQIGDDFYSRQACFEKAVRYKPNASHHWVALATEMQIHERIANPVLDTFESAAAAAVHTTSTPGFKISTAAAAPASSTSSASAPAASNSPTLYKWDCFAKALELNVKNYTAWVGLGQTLLSIREHGLLEALPSHFRGLSSATFAASLLSPDTLQPKSCFESALKVKFNCAQAWMSLVYIMGKDYVHPQDSVGLSRLRDQKLAQANSSAPRTLANMSTAPLVVHGAAKMPVCKIGGKEFTLKEAAIFAVEYNYKDAKAWGNLCAAMGPGDKAAIRDPTTAAAADANKAAAAAAAAGGNSGVTSPVDPTANMGGDELLMKKYEVAQRAIVLFEEGNTVFGKQVPIVGRWWLDIAMSMCEPGTQLEYDPRPERIVFPRSQQQMTKYDCIEKAIEHDPTLSLAWSELASYWSRRVSGERVGTERVFHDFTTMDLVVRSLTLDNRNAVSWMQLWKTISDCKDDDDDLAEIGLADGSMHSCKSSLQRALECDKHLARAWQLLPNHFRPTEARILVCGALLTKEQCIVRALEENDQLYGGCGEPITDEIRSLVEKRKAAEKATIRGANQQQQQQPEQYVSVSQKQLLEPFTDDELFALWTLMGATLLEKQQAFLKTKQQQHSVLQGAMDVSGIIEKESGIAPGGDDNNSSSSSSSVGRSSGRFKNEDKFGKSVTQFPVHTDSLVGSVAATSGGAAPASELSMRINWSGTGIKTEIFTAERCFIKALTISNTSAAAWYGLALSLPDKDKKCLVHNARWTKQSCLEKALTFDPTIKDAWVVLGELLPDDQRTGCAYVNMQRVGRQQCYEKALELIATGTASLGSCIPQSELDPKPVSTPETEAAIWCLFGSTLKPGMWLSLNGEMTDQKRCFFKALALDMECEQAWMALGYVAFETGTVDVPVAPSVSLDTDEGDTDDNKSNGSVTARPSMERNAAGAAAAVDNALVPPAAVLRPKPKKTITFTAAECFERAAEIAKKKAASEEEKQAAKRKLQTLAPSPTGIVPVAPLSAAAALGAAGAASAAAASSSSPSHGASPDGNTPPASLSRRGSFDARTAANMVRRASTVGSRQESFVNRSGPGPAASVRRGSQSAGGTGSGSGSGSARVSAVANDSLIPFVEVTGMSDQDV